MLCLVSFCVETSFVLFGTLLIPQLFLSKCDFSLCLSTCFLCHDRRLKVWVCAFEGGEGGGSLTCWRISKDCYTCCCMYLYVFLVCIHTHLGLLMHMFVRLYIHTHVRMSTCAYLLTYAKYASDLNHIMAPVINLPRQLLNELPEGRIGSNPAATSRAETNHSARQRPANLDKEIR